MAEVKVTRKDIYARIMERCADDPEIVELCTKQIAALSKPRKRKANPENEALDAAVLVKLRELEEPILNKDMAVLMEVSSQKMAHSLKRLIAAGVAEVVEVEGAKKSETFYAAVAMPEPAEEF